MFIVHRIKSYLVVSFGVKQQRYDAVRRPTREPTAGFQVKVKRHYETMIQRTSPKRRKNTWLARLDFLYLGLNLPLFLHGA